MSRKLDNYLRAYRKRSGFSQEEVAFLLGTRSGSKVSRHERLRRVPTLRTAFAYEVLFGIPAREIFAGVFASIERVMGLRAHQLAQQLRTGHQGRTSARRVAVLEAIGGLHRNR